MARVVVLGGSFGGLTTAFELRRLLGKTADITVVSKDDRFVFFPSLPWLIMGWRRPEDITLRVGEILKPEKIKFIHGTARETDPDGHKIMTTSGLLNYDYLIIATGPHLSFEEIPGLGPENGHTDCTFTLDHAVKTSRTWRQLLEDPGPVIVGSSQMVSCFGPSYELAFEMDLAGC